jgi:hypothetical protein
LRSLVDHLMKYYGYLFPRLSSINHTKSQINVIYNILGIKIKKKFGLNRILFYFWLPPHWNFLYITSVVNQRHLYFYSLAYFFKFALPDFISSIFYLPSSRSFCFFYTHTNNFFKHFLRLVKLLFYSFSFFFFKKIKFKGKGYYIFKNKRNTITFRFGYSHRIYLYFFGNFVKFLSKTSIFIFGVNYREIVNYGHNLISTRPYNLFTGKGVRFTRQIIYKKIGKVGSYR